MEPPITNVQVALAEDDRLTTTMTVDLAEDEQEFLCNAANIAEGMCTKKRNGIPRSQSLNSMTVIVYVMVDVLHFLNVRFIEIASTTFVILGPTVEPPIMKVDVDEDEQEFLYNAAHIFISLAS